MVSYNKQIIYGVISIIVFSALFLVGSVFADPEWGTGTGSPVAGNNDKDDSYYDCRNEGNEYPRFETYSRCPRWIKVPQKVYIDEIVNNKSRQSGTYNDLPECNNDEYVVIAGNQRKDGSLILYNMSPTKEPSKMKHVYTGVAESINSVKNHKDWVTPNETSFFADKVEGSDMTYLELLEKVKDLSGETEENISVFCRSMVEYDYDIFTVSNVSNKQSDNKKTARSWDNSDVTTSAKPVCPGEDVGLVFSHNILSNIKVDDGVGWSISRTWYLNGAEMGNGFSKNEYFSVSRWEDSNQGQGTPSMNEGESLKGTSIGVAIIVDDSPDRDTVVGMAAEETGAQYYDGGVDGRYYFEGNYYTVRDSYKIKFNKSGTYKFCEKFDVEDVDGNTIITNVCSEIAVKNNCSSIADMCNVWAPSSYRNSGDFYGVTSTLSAVKNDDAGIDWQKSNGKRESDFAKNQAHAKPGDTIEWMNCYYPGVQYTAYTKVSTRHGAHGGCTRTSNGNVYAYTHSGIRPWSNQYDVKQTNMNNKNNAITIRNLPFGRDGAGIKSFPNTYNIVIGGSESRTGLVLSESMISGVPREVRITDHGYHSWCCWVRCGDGGSCCSRRRHSEPWRTYSVDHGSYLDMAMLKVPYNFENTTKTKISNPLNNPLDDNPRSSTYARRNNYVYAGESVKISTEVNVGERLNKAAGNRSYSTRVDQSEVRLITYTTRSGDQSNKEIKPVKGYDTNLCNYLPGYQGVSRSLCDYAEIWGVKDGEGRNGVLNPEEKLNGRTYKDLVAKLSHNPYNVYDVAAGTYYCVATAVYPYEPSGDSDVKEYRINATEGIIEQGNTTPWKANGNNYSWYISQPDCRIVAKKPSLQVWGNSLFTNNDILLDTSMKRVVSGVHDFTPTAVGTNYAIDMSKTPRPNFNGNTTIFGSWVEQGIVANGKILGGVNSGYSIGGIASGASTGETGNNKERTPSHLVGGSKEGGSISICIRHPITMPNPACSSALNPGGGRNSMPAPEDKLALIDKFVNSDVSSFERVRVDEINGMNVPKGLTQVFYSNSDITIKSNIIYADGFTKMIEIPKVIIYAKNNINISCDVTQIDAVIIAEKVVNTCWMPGGEPDVNAEIRSRQLKINGAVISNSLEAKRTYGAQVGTRSGEPAEIINYDTSLYLWGSPRADISGSGKLDTVYRTELSPRY